MHAWRALGGGDGSLRGAGGQPRPGVASADGARLRRRAHRRAASRWRSPRSTAPASGRCAPTSRRRAAPRRAAGDGRGRRAARARRRLRHLRPHPPRRPAARRRCRASGTARGAAAARGWSTPAAGPMTSIFLTRTPGESPYWPGTCVLVEDDGPPRSAPAARPHARRSCAAESARRRESQPRCGAQADPGVKHVARQRTPAPISSRARPPCGARARSAGRRPDASTVSSRLPLDAVARDRTVPTPSSTAHTPPASYGPE